MNEDETLESLLGLEPENSRDAILQNDEESDVDFEDSNDENENYEDSVQLKRGKAKIYLNWKRFDNKESFEKW